MQRRAAQGRTAGKMAAACAVRSQSASAGASAGAGAAAVGGANAHAYSHGIGMDNRSRCFRQLGANSMQQQARTSSSSSVLPGLGRGGGAVAGGSSSSSCSRPGAAAGPLGSLNLMMRTHAGEMLDRMPSATGSRWSSASSQPPGSSRGGGGGGGGGGSSHHQRRFYATAPQFRIESTDVEKATGVRLSDDQLSALRRRYQGGHTAAGAFGALALRDSGGEGSPTSDEIRQEVFGGMVLKPGQWPRFKDSGNSDCIAGEGGRGGRSATGSSLGGSRSGFGPECIAAPGAGPRRR